MAEPIPKHPTQCRIGDCARFGRHDGLCHKHHWTHKLNEKQRLEIIRRRMNGEKLKVLAADFGITMGYVTRLMQRKVKA